jgi:tetratricopeptide (TPR) repeat protein
MRPARTGACWVSWFTLFATVFPLAAQADDRAVLIELRAGRLAAAGECDAMIALAEAAPEPVRSTPRLLRLRGNCLIELGRYGEALSALRAAREADPALADVDLLIAIALYHEGDLPGAAQALERARGASARTAELDLYAGLILLQQGEPRGAALALERARNTDAEAVEPVASYYAALAWQADRERDRARAALARVQALDPDGPWARQALQALVGDDNLSPYWARLTVGLEYDSNVRLAPKGDFPDRGDFAATWAIEGGARLFEHEDWSGGVVASYLGTAQFDLTEFNTQYPVAGVWVERLVGDRDLLRLRYDAGFAWVDAEPFLFSQYTRAAWIHEWANAGVTEWFVAGVFNDYRFDIVLETNPPPPIGVTARDRNRTGEGVHAGFEHAVPLGETSVVGRFGFTYQHYWSRGQEWDYDSVGVNVGASMLLPAEVELQVGASYAYQPHLYPTTFNSPNVSPANPPPAPLPRATKDRRDHITTLDIMLEKDLSEHWTVSTAYRLVDSHSNAGFFEYTRNIIGVYLSVTLP